MQQKKREPTPVVIVPRQHPNTVMRLGTPSAFIMLLGLVLIYYAVHGWDAKYGTFNGSFAGKGSIPSGTKPRIIHDASATTAAINAGVNTA
jgi:hypothetical protein